MVCAIVMAGNFRSQVNSAAAEFLVIIVRVINRYGRSADLFHSHIEIKVKVEDE